MILLILKMLAILLIVSRCIIELVRCNPTPLVGMTPLWKAVLVASFKKNSKEWSYSGILGFMFTLVIVLGPSATFVIYGSIGVLLVKWFCRNVKIPRKTKRSVAPGSMSFRFHD